MKGIRTQAQISLKSDIVILLEKMDFHETCYKATFSIFDVFY